MICKNCALIYSSPANSARAAARRAIPGGTAQPVQAPAICAAAARCSSLAAYQQPARYSPCAGRRAHRGDAAQKERGRWSRPLWRRCDHRVAAALADQRRAQAAEITPSMKSGGAADFLHMETHMFRRVPLNRAVATFVAPAKIQSATCWYRWSFPALHSLIAKTA
jgi:hypothetical protein